LGKDDVNRMRIEDMHNVPQTIMN